MEIKLDKIKILLNEINTLDSDIKHERSLANNKLTKFNNDINRKSNKFNTLETSLKKFVLLKENIKKNERNVYLEFLYSFIIVGLILYLLF